MKKIYVAWLLSLLGMLGSLYVSEIAGYPPCELCWYQRMCLFPLVWILGISLWRKETHFLPYVIAFPILGSVIAVCQVLLQEIPAFSHLSLCGAGSDCHHPAFRLMGWLTLPMLSLVNFALITYLLIRSK